MFDERDFKANSGWYNPTVADVSYYNEYNERPILRQQKLVSDVLWAVLVTMIKEFNCRAFQPQRSSSATKTSSCWRPLWSKQLTPFVTATRTAQGASEHVPICIYKADNCACMFIHPSAMVSNKKWNIVAMYTPRTSPKCIASFTILYRSSVRSWVWMLKCLLTLVQGCTWCVTGPRSRPSGWGSHQTCAAPCAGSSSSSTRRSALTWAQ